MIVKRIGDISIEPGFILRCVLPLCEWSKTRLGEDHLLRMNRDSVHPEQSRSAEAERERRRARSRVFLRGPLVTTIFFLLPVFSFLDAQVPTITSFTPLTAPVGSTVTINGSNFSATPSNNIVYSAEWKLL